MIISLSDKKRFWKRISWVDDTFCWNWKGPLTDGYGQMKIKGFMEGVHRVSWTIHYGQIPNNKFVLHKCDNRCCVNPSHLFIGTNQDNMTDMANKGRAFSMKGESHVNHKLSEKEVIEIRKFKGKRQNAKLAEKFGVKIPAIWKIQHNLTWSHI